ncbi:MAG: phosphodiester glycosidase family protein [Treponema sp.]
MIRARHTKNAKTAPVRLSESFLLCALLSAFFLPSCKTAAVSPKDAPLPFDKSFHKTHGTLKYHQIDEGIYFTSFTSKQTGIQYHLVKIDLSNPALAISASPHSDAWRRAESVKAFAARTASLIALNTVPFYAENRLPFAKVKPAGLVIIDGKTVSEPKAGYCALAFFADERGFCGRIFHSQKECLTQFPSPKYAFGGFWVILDGGVIIPFKEYKDFRSAAGLADGGKTLFLLAGKNLSFYDCALILKNAGADSAMEFDGGSSSQMCVKQKRLLIKFDRNPASVLGIKFKRSNDE